MGQRRSTLRHPAFPRHRLRHPARQSPRGRHLARHHLRPFRRHCHGPLRPHHRPRRHALLQGVRPHPLRLLHRYASRPRLLLLLQTRRHHAQPTRRLHRPSGRHPCARHTLYNGYPGGDDGRHSLWRRHQHPRVGRRAGGLQRCPRRGRPHHRPRLRRRLPLRRGRHHPRHHLPALPFPHQSRPGDGPPRIRGRPSRPRGAPAAACGQEPRPLRPHRQRAIRPHAALRLCPLPHPLL